MKQRTPELEEGPAAFERFRKAVKVALTVPKVALPPRPHRAKKWREWHDELRVRRENRRIDGTAEILALRDQGYDLKTNTRGGYWSALAVARRRLDGMA